jgi:aspartyl-tRNA(Asn)/glutamyl-tRNA(Gln) amidotransferase subunit B
MYKAVIGLECHVQLNTASKLFCSCPVVDGRDPNTAVCPVCLGHPGTLPVINERAVALSLQAALATSCTVHERSIFARKQYFYPDLPKGYQTTQFEQPLATAGRLRIDVAGQERVIRVHRIHIEEDAGKSVHESWGTGVDFNRAGTPLVEIVSEADMTSPEEAESYFRMMHRVMVAAGVTQGDMEKGHVRADANVSVHKPGTPWGTKVEIKNLNSFRFVAKAVRFEIDRQIKAVQAGEPIVQETRMWRGNKTVAMRTKEGSSDYRYFPDPDLPPLRIEAQALAQARQSLPAAPMDDWLFEQEEALYSGYEQTYALDRKTIKILAADAALLAFFEACVQAGGDADRMSKWMLGEVQRHVNAGSSLSRSQLKPTMLVRLEKLIDEGSIGRTTGKDVFGVLWEKGGQPEEIVKEQGLSRIADVDSLEKVVASVLAQHPAEVEKYRGGNRRVFGFFMGQVMRATQGQADASVAKQLVSKALDEL